MSLVSMTITTVELASYFTKIAMFLCIGLLACIIFVWRNKANKAISFFVYTISFVFIFVASYLGMLGGTLADELNLGGNVLPELTVIVLGIITIFSPFGNWQKTKQHEKTRYPFHFRGMNSGFSFTPIPVFQDPSAGCMCRLCRRAYCHRKFRRLA